MPLALALKSGNTEIFKTLLNTEGGMSAVAIWHYEFRSILRGPENSVFFLPSYLYAAIEMKREDMAIALVNHPFVDVESPGEFMSGGLSRQPSEAELSLIKKPFDLARAYGLPRLAEAIEQKLKPAMAKRASQQADDLSAQAAAKRAEAERLMKEADLLSPKPAAPKPGFNL